MGYASLRFLTIPLNKTALVGKPLQAKVGVAWVCHKTFYDSWLLSHISNYAPTRFIKILEKRASTRTHK